MAPYQRNLRRPKLLISKHAAQKVGTRCRAVSTQGSQQVCLSWCPKCQNLKPFAIRGEFFQHFSRSCPAIFLANPRRDPGNSSSCLSRPSSTKRHLRQMSVLENDLPVGLVLLKDSSLLPENECEKFAQTFASRKSLPSQYSARIAQIVHPGTKCAYSLRICFPRAHGSLSGLPSTQVLHNLLRHTARSKNRPLYRQMLS